MPIYGFECPDCGHRYDRLQKLSDPDPTECPACQSTAVRRQISAPSFRLAGSGWYETDFKKDGDKKRNLADGAGSGSGSGSEAPAAKGESGGAAPATGGGTSSETKPAAPAAAPAAGS